VSYAHIPFLQQLTPEDAADLTGRVKRRTLKPGTELLRAGAAGDEAVLVLEGRVRLLA
jgi:CRP-like cAMP-binding protein